MKLSEHIQAGIQKSIILREKARFFAMKNPYLTLEPKYGKVRIMVESVFDLQNLLSLGFTWKLEDGYGYGAEEDPLLGCDISWKFLREFMDSGLEKL
ncbi:MAG: hypothetical protein EHM28_13330, partial [Spirochaetaceae bacterium]